MYPRNYKFPVRINQNDWKQNRDGSFGIYNQWQYSNYPLPRYPGYQRSNTAEFIQDNIHMNRDGSYVVRAESDYELRNTVVLPYETRRGFIITPRRLARDPSDAIHNYYHGWRKDTSDQHVLGTTTRWKDQLLNRRRLQRN